MGCCEQRALATTLQHGHRDDGSAKALQVDREAPPLAIPGDSYGHGLRFWFWFGSGLGIGSGFGSGPGPGLLLSLSIWSYLRSPVSSCSPPPLWAPRAHSETGISTRQPPAPTGVA